MFLVRLTMQRTQSVALWLPLEASDSLLDLDRVDGDLLLLDVEDFERARKRALLALHWSVHAYSQVLALVLPCHFDRLNIVQILDADFVTPRNADNGDSGGCFALFGHPVRDVVVNGRPGEAAHARALQTLLVQQTTVRHFIHGNGVGSLTREKTRIVTPLQVRPIHLTRLRSNWHGKLALLRHAEHVVHDHR